MTLRWKVVASVALVMSAGSFLFTVVVFKDQTDESKTRRDQTCTITEREQKTEVEQLRRTYGYLLKLSPRERGEPINVAVLEGLPALEERARFDNAPEYCDEEGIGLPEPDERIPPRPAGLR